ncbi:CRAL-TRIO domain-containing protein [Halteromyces radiatus]|uniref:CRAL-TRIO domain-containing protein n=1 Tax=Halteromyces radiatus TaxID=101107 RepID=UPI00222117BF|nr:CRAL-TRIO domain-containing protein [Halteromyces radiatus]KAI8096360.1 CRAL-TRIO domain-containing protein [Halteromyces radiatus]
MDFHQRKLEEVNQLYKEHELTIEKLHAAVRREIPLLVQEYQLDLPHIKALEDFVNDKLTLFRYLRKNNYSLPVALSLLLDTIRWRLEEQVDKLTIYHVQELLSMPLCFFHHQDRWGRPVLVIQLSHFPRFKDNTDLLASVVPLVIFLLEIGRKRLLDLTRQRKEQNIPNPVIADLIVLVDFKDANSLPKDFTLVQTFIKLLKRYPGTAGMVCLLNFGWMYQGMWQMIKVILSQEAKNRVAFPKLKELKSLIDEDHLITALGGKDEFEWNLEQDTLLIQYQNKYNLDEKEEIPISMQSSRRNSSSSLYFDSMDIFSTTTTGLSTPTSSRRYHHHSLAPLTKLHHESNLRPIYSRRTSTNSSYSLYATPTGTLTPIPTNTISASASLISNSQQQQQQQYSDISKKSGFVKSGINKLFGQYHQQGGISSWALSQRLMTLQQQQQQQEQQEDRQTEISIGKGQQRKSWLRTLLNWILSLENKMAFSLLDHRYWIYGLVLLWFLRKLFVTRFLSHHRPLYSSTFKSLMLPKQQHPVIKLLLAPFLMNDRDSH